MSGPGASERTAEDGLARAPIPYGRQEIDESDIRAVVEVLRSERITQGPAIEAFERAVAGVCGARHGVAVSSGTAALHLACLALELKPGDWLWTSPNTFVASANCGRYCGCQVDFVDIDPRTYNLSVAALREKLAWAEKHGRLPKALVGVDFAGQPCEWADFRALLERYGCSLIADACHALGANYRGKPVGDGRFADVTVLSFHPVKIITTGEGGMVLTNRAELHEKLVRLRSHGITRDPARMDGPTHGPWYYQQIDLGFNYRMTDLQAALGASQARRLPAFLARRRSLARRYDQMLSGLPVTLPWQHPETESSWHLYVVRLKLAELRRTKAEVFAALHRAGILVNVHYIPVHTQPDFRSLGFRPGDFPEAERYYAEAMTLPLFPGLSDSEQERVVATLAEVLR